MIRDIDNFINDVFNFELLFVQKFSKILTNRYRFRGKTIFIDKITYAEYKMIEEFLEANYNLLKNKKYKSLGFEKWEGTKNIFLDIF